MIRATILTLALAIASTAASTQAGGFQIKFGGNNGSHKNHQNFGFKQNNHVHVHKPKVYTTCYYKVCYKQPSWNFTKHKTFYQLSDAKHFAYELESYGLQAKISKVHSR